MKEFHKRMYRGRYIYGKRTQQAYCETCGTFLADRFVEGRCPECGREARGDQCESCGKVLEPELIISPKCFVCGGTPVFRQTKHLCIALSEMEDDNKKIYR